MRFLLLLVIVASIGGYYYFKHPNAINQAKTTGQAIVTTTVTDVDNVTMGSFKAAGVDAQVYYLKHRNYGTSSKQNICVDVTSNGGVGDVVSAIKKVNNSITCAVATDYPSRSFTITVPSLVHKGQFYCTDQGGFIGLIPNTTKAPFESGVKCQ